MQHSADFVEKYSATPISYERYRKTLSEMNIAFYDVEAHKCGFCIEMEINPTDENIILKDEHLKKVSLILYDLNDF